MIRVSLSGAVWIEDVPGQDLILVTPPNSFAYYADTQEDLEILDGEPNQLGDESAIGTRFRVEFENRPFCVCPDGDFPPVLLNVLTPDEIFRLEGDTWVAVDARDAPRTIDRRRTLWQRVKGDE